MNARRLVHSVFFLSALAGVADAQEPQPLPAPPASKEAPAQRLEPAARPSFGGVSLKLAASSVREGDNVDLRVRVRNHQDRRLPSLTPASREAGALVVLVRPAHQTTTIEQDLAQARTLLDAAGPCSGWRGVRYALPALGARTFLTPLFGGPDARRWLAPGRYVIRVAYRTTPGDLLFAGRDDFDWKTPLLSNTAELEVLQLAAERAPTRQARAFLSDTTSPIPALGRKARDLVRQLRPSLARRVRWHLSERMHATYRSPAQRKLVRSQLTAFLRAEPSPAERERCAVLLADLYLEAGEPAAAREALQGVDTPRAVFLREALD